MNPSLTVAQNRELAQPLRRRLIVSGVVQGVGFRPFVYRLAQDLGLHGFVLNRAGEVHIEAQGAAPELDAFTRRLRAEAPPLARIDGLAAHALELRGERDFSILESQLDAAASPLIAPDAATCDRCLKELFDPGDRRYRYPFVNCTDCGPRFTIVVSAPYDRERTTMRGFELCAECRSEYENPESRRFHAQPNACSACGPTLTFGALRGAPALAAALEALRAGKLLAIKGIGGFHLACRADDESAVRELRRRKGRDKKPFALMVADLAAGEALAELQPRERELLATPERPIVLLRRRGGAALAEAVAPGCPLVGVMLPYTPLHHLLLAGVGTALVMTSGNASDEPIAFEDADALRLAAIADGIVGHDRPIRLRCDDSVMRALPSGPVVLRRARGATPRPQRLEQPLRRPILALGAQSNATFALGREGHVFVSHHLGDLDHYAAARAYDDAIEHYQALFAIEPALLVHDLHPDYGSTHVALRLAAERGLPRVAVQHHHAHLAACLLEHGLDEPVLGVAFDGTGIGDDGSLWGGEFLLCDRRSFRRVAHLRPVPLPGGERAVLEPWRMAAAYAHDAGAGLDALARHEQLGRVLQLLERGAFCPPSSGAGRLFDAVSALLGISARASYDGQAAIELEWAATGCTASGVYPFELTRTAPGAPWIVDTRPLFAAVADEQRRGVDKTHIARRFHCTLGAAIVATLEKLRAEYGLSSVVLGGGVFHNAILVEELELELPRRGFTLYRPQSFPAGDGGLSLGQLCIAAAQDAAENS
jgi:hydrogenase maturation protein HypF